MALPARGLLGQDVALERVVALHLPPLELEVVLVDLGPELHFLDLDVLLVLARLGLALGLLVEELSGVHDPADRRRGRRSDLHQVQALLLRDAQSLGRRHDAELGAIVVDDTDLLRANAIVDADRPRIYETPPAATICGASGSSSSTLDRSAARRAIFAP